MKLKMKTHRGAAKRFRKTASGRVRPIEAFAHLDRAFLRRHYVIGGIGGLLFLAFA